MRGSDRVEGSVTNMGDSALIDRFLDMMAAEKGAAANTLLAYRSDLVQASVVLGGRLEHVDRIDLTKLRDAWASLETATAARKASALRRFFFFLQDGTSDVEGSRG